MAVAFMLGAAAGSHSLRSAWIEITFTSNPLILYAVALLTECVDRNRTQLRSSFKVLRRTPYGVRG